MSKSWRTSVPWVTLITTPRAVNWVAGISFGTLLCKILWLNHIAASSDRIYDLGQLAENLLAATVAAYIFFVISYQLPQTLERKAVGPSIATLTDRVVHNVVNVLYILNYHVNGVDKRTLPDPVTAELVTALFKAINPNANSIFQGTLFRQLTLFEYMIDESAKFSDSIDQVWRYARFIDAELAAKLDDVRLSQHVAAMSMMSRIRAQQNGRGSDEKFTIANADLSEWALAYFHCYESAIRLREYCTRYRQLYGIV